MLFGLGSYVDFRLFQGSMTEPFIMWKNKMSEFHKQSCRTVIHSRILSTQKPVPLSSVGLTPKYVGIALQFQSHTSKCCAHQYRTELTGLHLRFYSS